MTISVQKAELIGGFLEILIYGVYVMTVFETIGILRKSNSRRFGDLYLYASAVAMFVGITLHEVIDIVRALQAFTSDELNPEHPNQYYNDVESTLGILKTAVYTAVTFISDGFIVYRTYIVWNRSLLVAFLPAILFAGDIAMGITSCYELKVLKAGRDTFTAHALAQRAQAFYALTLSLNVICTLSIAYRIWSIQRETVLISSTSSRMSSTRIANILIESCAVYSAFLFLLIGTYVANSPAMFIFLDMVVPIIGVVFFSLINRVKRGVSHGDHITGTQAGRNLSTVRHFGTRSGLNPSMGITVETDTESHDMESFQLGVRMQADGTVITEKTLATSLMSKQGSLADSDAVPSRYTQF